MDTLQRANALGGLQPSGQPYPTPAWQQFRDGRVVESAVCGVWQRANAAQQAAPAAAAPTNPYDMNQAYLDALANPGHVRRRGRRFLRARRHRTSRACCSSFWRIGTRAGGQTKGAGNYDNSGFFNALKGMV